MTEIHDYSYYITPIYLTTYNYIRCFKGLVVLVKGHLEDIFWLHDNAYTLQLSNMTDMTDKYQK